MSKDHRRLSSVFNVRADSADENGATIRFYGRNTTGEEVVVTVHLSWWLWPTLVKYVAKLWVQERLRRLSDITDIDEGFPPERKAS